MTILLEDLTLPHQIVLRYSEGGITVSCTCQPYTLASQHGGRPRHEVIEARTLFPAADAIACWRAWHEERGVELT